MKKICEGNCLGCGVCVDVCQKNAIQFVIDENGFYLPKIDQSLCVECSACSNVCIVNNPVDSNKSLKVYYGNSTDKEMLLRTTSGGIVGELYQIYLKAGYSVCGVVYDEDWHCQFMMTKNETDVLKFHGSKYVGADTTGIYKAVKNELKEGRGVFFVGTPCQCAGLKNFLGKGYEKLVICDFICFGVASQTTLNKYLSEIAQGDRVVEYMMRGKKKGYVESYSNIKLKSGRMLSDVNFYRTDFGYLFASKLILKKECFDCPFACQERVGDITVGDWKDHISEYQKQYGCSLVLCNTKKGQLIIDQLISHHKIELEIMDHQIAVEKCWRLSKKMEIPRYRDACLDLIKNKTIHDLSCLYQKKSKRFRISHAFFKIGNIFMKRKS